MATIASKILSPDCALFDWDGIYHLAPRKGAVLGWDFSVLFVLPFFFFFLYLFLTMPMLYFSSLQWKVAVSSSCVTHRSRSVTWLLPAGSSRGLLAFASPNAFRVGNQMQIVYEYSQSKRTWFCPTHHGRLYEENSKASLIWKQEHVRSNARFKKVHESAALTIHT